MNQKVTTALALAALGTISFAGGTDSEWSGLDQQLKKLKASSTGLAGMNLDFGANVRTAFRGASNGIASSVGGQSGVGTNRRFTLDNAELWSEFSVGDLDARISIQGDSGGFDEMGSPTGGSVWINEAFADWNVSNNGIVRVGLFQLPTARSANLQESRLLFIDRTYIAGLLGAATGEDTTGGETPTVGLTGVNGSGVTNLGVGYIGNNGDFDYGAAIQNGSQAAGDRLFAGGRVQWNMNGGVSGVEGSYNAPQETRLTVGVFGQVDSELDASQAFGFDVYGTMGPLNFSAEFVTLDDTNPSGSETPFDFTVGYQFNDQMEAAVRYEEFDIAALQDSMKLTAGLNFYMLGHDAKWSVNVGTADFGGDNDGSFILGGLSIGANGGTSGPLGAGMTRND